MFVYIVELIFDLYRMKEGSMVREGGRRRGQGGGREM